MSWLRSHRADRATRSGPASGRARPFVEALLDALPNPVFVKDEQHRWVLLNDLFCEFMGHPREELLGKSDYDFFPKEEADVFWDKDDAVFRSGELNENEEALTDAAGRAHVILTRKTLHRDPEGRRYLLGIITDITERKQIEEELRRSRDALDGRVRERTIELERVNRQLQEEARRKNEFLGILSHELRNPLAPILNALQIAERARPGGEQAAGARAVIRRQLDHLTRLVDDLLDVTRISRGKVQLHRTHVDLEAVLRRTAEDHRPLFQRRELRLDVRLPGVPTTVDADPTRIAQIVGNLLQNAAKFTPSGGAVELSLERSAGRATVRVRDTGIGIAPQILQRIFEPFTQADDSLHRSAGGLGLGLALVRGFAELQGGTATARSEGPGRGAEVEVSFPVIREPPVAPTPTPVVTAAAPRRRVLVVEDNPDAAETLREMLEMSGHVVDVAADGRTAIARARAFRPGVVLCDLGLPELDGYAVARALRADPAVAQATLVAVSGYALPDDQRRALEAGFDLHLAKPVPLAVIEEVLARPPRGDS